MKNTKTLSSHAAAAAAIRSELKAAFPSIKFSVTSESFSMGNAVRVNWTDGPTVKEVDSITDKYAYGRFDGMTDYAYSEHNDSLPQAKYVTTSRNISEAAREEVRSKYTFDDSSMSGYEQDLYINRKIYETSFMKPAAPAAAPEAAAPAVSAKGIEVVEYSERAIAVFGDTKAVKDQLRAMGGKFNAFLNREGVKTAGWIFSKRHESQVRAFAA
jgi:hypothetical protein